LTLIFRLGTLVFMPRKLRLQYEGALYYVMSKGKDGSAVFRNDKDRASFVEALGQACSKTGWQIHAYCLMKTHFHLVVETPRANLASGMKWLLSAYTIPFNRRYKVNGPVFSGRYKAVPIDGKRNAFLRSACDYVHLEPVRAKLVKPQSKLSGYPWSSYREYLKTSQERPDWVRVDRLLKQCGIPNDNGTGRRHFEKRMEARRGADEAEFRTFRRGWYVGGPEFRKELLARLKGKRGDYFGKTMQESEEARAEAYARKALREAGLREKDLASLPKGAPQKLKVARRLRQETTMTIGWIADRLNMGTTGYLNHLFYWEGKTKPKPTK
jgi:putative transposase